MKLISADTIPIQVKIDDEPWERFEYKLIENQKPLDADIQEIVDNNFSKLLPENKVSTPKHLGV